MTKVTELLDKRYNARRKILHGVVTSAPMTDGRSAGYVIATVNDMTGVYVNVSPDQRTPIVANDTIIVEGIGTAAAISYWVTGRIGGGRSDSDVYVFPAGTITGSTTYGAGDILLGSTLADWSNWWYQFANGRWVIRKGTTMHGAIGNLDDLYDYTSATYGTVFGRYIAGDVFVAMDPVNGFRINRYTTPIFQADAAGVVWALSTLRAGAGDNTVGMIATDPDWLLYAGKEIPANAPFRVNKTGSVWADNITMSGTINSAVFSQARTSAIAGSQISSKSAAALGADCTLTGTTYSLTIKVQDGDVPFSSGDLVYIKNETLEAYATIDTGASSGEGLWTYTATYKGASTSGVIKAGEAVVNYGPNNYGRAFLTADNINAPYLSIATHDMATPPVWTERVRIGNLDGVVGSSTYPSGYRIFTDGEFSEGEIVADSGSIYGISSLETGPSGYGIWTDNGFFKGEIVASSGVISGFLTLGVSGGIYQGTYKPDLFGILGDATRPRTGLKIWNEDDIGRIAGYNEGVLQWGMDTDGKLKAGAGAVTLDASGIAIGAGSIVIGTTNKIWLNDANDGGLAIGGTLKAVAPLRISSAGALIAENATIIVGTTNKIWLNDANDGSLAIGGTTKATASFRVSATGALVATDATIVGDFSANNGAIDIDDNGITVTSESSNSYFKLINSSIAITPAPIGFLNFDQSDPIDGTYGTVCLGRLADANNQSVLWCYPDCVSLAVLKGGVWKNLVQANFDFVRIEGPLRLPSGTSTPTASLQQAQIYVDSTGKLIIQWLSGGVTRYKWIALTDDSTTWSYSTTAP